MARFVGHYLGQVVASNARVAWGVITPRNERISEAIVACPLSTGSKRVALVVANAISFTPGSLTIALTGDPSTIYVHVLHYSTSEEVRAGVSALEERVARALGDTPDEANRG